MTYLISIAIGPVQEFIAAGRKTRDLWAGSQMLSDICEAVAKALAEKGGDLIFPPSNSPATGEKNDSSTSSVANKILLIYLGDKPEDFAGVAKSAATKKLEEVMVNALSALDCKGVRSHIREELIKKHFASFLEFYAAWVPLKADLTDYSDRRKEVELLLAGRKATRDFSAANGDPEIPKSSLDPSRDSVIRFDQVKSDGDKGKFLGLGIKHNEQLDGISLAKRVGMPQRFVSVARVAADPFIRSLDESDLEDLKKIAAILAEIRMATEFSEDDFPQYKEFKFDTQCFFTDAVAEDELPKGNQPDCKCEHPAVRFFGTVKKICKARGLERPSPYFAILQGDGDNMGATLSKISTPKEHKRFSEQLNVFSREAQEIVTEHSGAVVYCGGDDVLAFIPLDTVLKCAEKLAKCFKDVMGKMGGFADYSAKKPTFSCGVVIAHYSEHLQNVLRWAREAEKAAKDNGRNSLAVHLHKRTAGDELAAAVFRWDEIPVSDRLLKWIDCYTNGRIPFGTPYDLRTLAKDFKGMPADAVTQGVLKAEVKRVLNRRNIDEENRKIDEEAVKDLLNSAGDTYLSLDRFVDELIICRELSHAQAVPKGGASHE